MMYCMRTSDVAKLLGVHDYRIEYALKQGKIPEPSRVLDQRIYNDDDVQRLREYFASLGDKWKRGKSKNPTT